MDEVSTLGVQRFTDVSTPFVGSPDSRLSTSWLVSQSYWSRVHVMILYTHVSSDWPTSFQMHHVTVLLYFVHEIWVISRSHNVTWWKAYHGTSAGLKDSPITRSPLPFWRPSVAHLYPAGTARTLAIDHSVTLPAVVRWPKLTSRRSVVLKWSPGVPPAGGLHPSTWPGWRRSNRGRVRRSPPPPRPAAGSATAGPLSSASRDAHAAA